MALQKRNLSKLWHAGHRQVCLAVEPNTVHGLIGPNGSGKSTFSTSDRCPRPDEGSHISDEVGITNSPAHTFAGPVRKTFQLLRTMAAGCSRQCHGRLPYRYGRWHAVRAAGCAAQFRLCRKKWRTWIHRPPTLPRSGGRTVGDSAVCASGRPGDSPGCLLDEPGAGLSRSLSV